MGYPKRLLTDGEHVVREFRPHWRMLFMPAAWTVLLVGAAIATHFLPPENSVFDLVITAAALIAWLPLGFYPFVQWWFTWYVLTNERLITRKGVLARKGKEIPLESINDVSFSQTILERALRSGDLLIESAGEMGQSRFSNIPAPEQFQSLIYRVREERSRSLGSGPVTPPATDTASQLERLARLVEEGYLSREEYEAQKQALLGGGESPPPPQ
jgi:uncharacterized membrane protein YdbT with pleckstrin-like domain